MDIFNKISADTALGDCLETAFGLKTYVQIMDKVHNPGFCADEGFRKQFNGYYKVRQRKPEW